jgi:hypothetical protein
MKRVKKCCGLLQVTLEELAALCCVEWYLFKQWLIKDHVPSYVSLTLYNLEQDYIKAKYG